VKDGITGEKWLVDLACDSDCHVNHMVLLHVANLGHGTDGFTSPPKEGLLWLNVQTVSRAHPTSYSNCIRGSLSGDKEAEA
jgi:hypothetical protein